MILFLLNKSMNFKLWLENNIQTLKIEGEESLVFQYSPVIQVQSGLATFEREYFKDIFSEGIPSFDKFKEFIHSYVKGDPMGEKYGAKMLIYSDGKVVIGKAPYHSYLEYLGGKKANDAQGYYNLNNRKLTISHVGNTKAFNNIEVWKNALGNLKRAELITDDWIISGCPPVCKMTDKRLPDSITIKELLNQKEIGSSDDKSIKEKETENLVQNFVTQQAIQNKEADPKGYFYRRLGDSTNYI